MILLTAGDQTLLFTGLALALSIASFFWRRFPLIRKMDRTGQIDPGSYSAVLGWMILALVLTFLAAAVSQVL